TVLGEVAALLGDYPLARARLDRALKEGAASPLAPALTEAQARRHRLLALVGERTGAYDEAEAHCSAGLELMSELGLPNVETARLHAQLADIHLWRGDFEVVEQSCRDGLAALPPEPAAPRERITLLQRLGSLPIERGDYAAALAPLNESLAL